MHALVIYESVLGNTRLVADAIASGLRPEMDASLSEAGSAPSLLEVPTDLLVIGGPTHVWRMGNRETRPGAAGEAVGTGIREWIAAQKNHTVRAPVATFDTRLKMSLQVTGSTARHAARRLRRAGFHVMTPPESFFIEGESGPLYRGEQERAFQWGETLTVKLVTAR